ncbi:MAG TPA: tRNA pseudouridine(38-40) synthase TruA [Bacteroidia bacterium]|nr:tRNA pseudouridine(38-40) synthase TruA [Bacteroidia bacterium]
MHILALKDVRYFIQLAFDGSQYHGWQIQQNAHSVQAELNDALGKILRQSVETTGCGRTDTGVHARDFYVHMDAPDLDLSKHDFVHQLNCILPTDIAIKRIIPVHPDAHARFDAVVRTYEYRIHQQKDPFNNKYSTYFPYELDLDCMNQFGKILMEYSDFSAFAKTGSQNLTNICKLKDAHWTRKDHEIKFGISADRFLRNMVRAIVGTLLEAGRGKLNESEFRQILESKDRKEAGYSVPAEGLSLVEINYPYL